MKTFVIADTHFGHKNILRHCERPFPSAHEMDQAMISAWNSAVSPEDLVFHLGDFAWSNPEVYRRQLHGKIVLFMGNHDYRCSDVELRRAGFLEIHHGPEMVSIEGDEVWMSHYPHVSWPRSFHPPGRDYFIGAYHLFGHCHGTANFVQAHSIDVGVDMPWMNFAPQEWRDIKPRIANSQPCPC